jgi:rhodanese-related sulfurtransferase/DNA-binding transcriptional ArsR family regulator
MSTTAFKQQLFTQYARIAKALSSGNRLELLDYLAQCERNVEALAKLSGMSFANTSQHLQQLRRAGLVKSRKAGQHVLYSLADESVIDLLGLLRRLAQQNLAEVERLVNGFLLTHDPLEPLSEAELASRMKTGRITLLDVRPVEEYLAGHIFGAVSVPLADLESRLKTLPTDTEVVAYCRGPYCILSYQAVERLRAGGFKAIRLENGYPEWKVAGHPIDMSTP